MKNFTSNVSGKIAPVTLFKILTLFIISRVVLLTAQLYAVSKYVVCSGKIDYWHYSDNKILNLFGYWDSGWYMGIADNGYKYIPLGEGQSNLGFFPLYPLLIKLGSFITGSTYTGGILVSNILLFFAAIYLYKLCQYYFQQSHISTIAIIILFFFPGSYLYSGVFSESAFLCFSIVSIYYFEKGDYLRSGIAGCLLALTRPFGVLILIPMAISYTSKLNFTFSWKQLWLGLIPTGIFAYFLYCYYYTGDFLFYVHCKETGWGIESTNPIAVLIKGVREEPDLYVRFNTYYAIGILLLSTLLIRYIGLAGYVWILLLTLVPLQNGYVNNICLPRYISVCFPLLVGVAHFTSKNKIGWLLIAFLIFINIILSAFYALGYQFAA